MSVGVVPHSNQFETFLDININSENKTNTDSPKEDSKNSSTNTQKITGALIGLGILGAGMILHHKKVQKIKNQKFIENHKEFENVSSRTVNRLRNIFDKVSKLRSDVDEAYEKFEKDPTNKQKELNWRNLLTKFLKQDIAYCEASLKAKCGVNVESLIRDKSSKQLLLDENNAVLAKLREQRIANNAENLDKLSTRANSSSQN